MAMLEVFKKVVKEIPVELNVVSVKELRDKIKLVVEHGGTETTVELYKSCSPGEAKRYCWSVLATAMTSIYIKDGDYAKARLWMDALHDKSLITAENA